MKLIVACDPKGGIGYKNQLPWGRLQGDLPRFKALTDDQIVVMGRNTWESLPKKPLLNRTNLIVTTQFMGRLPNDSFSISNIDSVTDDAWIIGGAKLINSSWHRIHEIHLSLTKAQYTCDTFIELVYLHDNYVLSHEQDHVDHVYQIWKTK